MEHSTPLTIARIHVNLRPMVQYMKLMGKDVGGLAKQHVFYYSVGTIYTITI
jgi:hypothetical protein